MRAKAKAVLLAVLAWTAVSVPFTSRADETQDRCAYLAGFNADKLQQALTSYAGKVMGKDPEHWTEADYSNLAANAMACHGLPANVVDKVNGEFWTLKLSDAYKINAEINRTSLAIAAAYQKFWTSPEEFPACATFLRWKRDDVWYTNNSKELFGTAFQDMTPEMLGFFRRLVQECQPVMGPVLDRWRRHPSQAEGIVKSVVDSIGMDALAAQERDLDIPKKLMVTYGGDRIPIAYLRPTTQKVVKRVIALENTNRVMPTNSLIQISKWAKQVEDEDKEGPDMLYARVIKDMVADHMFRSADQLRAPGKASAGPSSGGQ